MTGLPARAFTTGLKPSALARIPVAPGEHLVVIRVPGQARGRAQPSGGGGLLIQVDMRGGPEQRQPAAKHDQAPMLGQVRPDIQQSPHIAQVLSDPPDQLVRWRSWIGNCQFVNGLFQPGQRFRADIAGAHPATKFNSRQFVLVRGPGDLGKCPGAGRAFLVELGCLELTEGSQQRAVGPAGLIGRLPEPVVRVGAALLDMRDGAAVAVRRGGKLSLGEFGGPAPTGQALAKDTPEFGNGLGLACHVTQFSAALSAGRLSA